MLAERESGSRACHRQSRMDGPSSALLVALVMLLVHVPAHAAPVKNVLLFIVEYVQPPCINRQHCSCTTSRSVFLPCLAMQLMVVGCMHAAT